MKSPLNTVLRITVFMLITGYTALCQIVKSDTTSNWKRKMVFNFSLNQASFSSNWKAGGVNSIGLNGAFNYRANYRKNKSSWDNELNFQYGFINNDGQGFRKTLDRIYFDTKYGYTFNKNWALFSSLNLLTQFDEGFKFSDDNAFLISDFFAPAFITFSLGVEYHPVDYFKVRVSPLSPRVTIVSNNNGRFTAVDTLKPYGVDIGSKARYERFAFQLTADFDKEIATNMNLKWRYMVFANYETLEVSSIDHRLDLMINAKVNRFISVGLGGILVYDKDQDSDIQLSQAFTFGFQYSFQNYEEKKK